VCGCCPRRSGVFAGSSGEGPQFLLKVAVVGKTALATPVILPGRFGREAADLRTQGFRELIYLTPAELPGLHDVLPDGRKLPAQTPFPG